MCNMQNISSILDDVVFIEIKKYQKDTASEEIIDIAGIKIDNKRIEYFKENINKREYFEKGRAISAKFKNFIGDNTIICCNKSKNINLIKSYTENINNEILDLLQLVSILRPYYKEYTLEYLTIDILNKVNLSSGVYTSLQSCRYMLEITNELLVELYQKEEATLEPLTFKINSYLNKYNLSNWAWSKFIDQGKEKDWKSLIIDSQEVDGNNASARLRYVMKSINAHSRKYEELLKDQKIWQSKKGFIYEYRKGQYELSKTIRETIQINKATPKIACIEAPTGIGKSVGYLLPTILESYTMKKKIIISTDTKELQIQLINKDIPNIINSLGLNSKIKYGYMKGKNNYICVDKLESYKDAYDEKRPTESEVLGILYLENLVNDGKYGDIEEVSDWVVNNFENILTHIRGVRCDPNICRPKRCIKECLYKNRVEELKEEDITVVNHSLLAKWPYKEEKPLENIVVDEAHNLTEKGYEFFSSIIDSRALAHFLDEIYPYEYMSTKIGGQHKNFKIKPFDKFYNSIRLDSSMKKKISENINFIYESINKVLTYCATSDYANISKYNLRWELNLQEDMNIGKSLYSQNQKELTFKELTEVIKESCETMIRNMTSILVILDRNMDDDTLDKESDNYKYGKGKIKDLEDMKTVLQILLENNEDDDFARIIDIDRNFNFYEMRVSPLKLADLFEENILSQLHSGIFISATLNVEGNMGYFKRTLGINRVENMEQTIESLYDYEDSISLISISDMCSYKNNNFIIEMSRQIYNLNKVTEGRMLCLFNSRERLEGTYNILSEHMHRLDIDVYSNKGDVNKLKDIDKKSVVLGSKGCFEGVDVPGDGLVCVTLDKIPNISPTEPLYYAIMKKYNLSYHTINYPQMAIKLKQAMGRILRSKYDYGCFIIFNLPNNNQVTRRLERDLHNCRIKHVPAKNLSDVVRYHLELNRRRVANILVNDLLKTHEKIDNKNKDSINIEIRNRSILGNIVEINKNNSLKLNYFNKDYIIKNRTT